MIPLQNATDSSESFESVTREFVDGILGVLPKILSGIVFLLLSYLFIKFVLTILHAVLDRMYPEDEDLIVDLFVVIVGVFLWFAVGLALLKIIGLGDVAAGLGTSAGFIGLGIAYALKEMIADTVAGVYLLRDPDFNVGDRVETASVTGTIRRIDLRKTRIESEDGDLVVVANSDVEKKWVQIGSWEMQDDGDSTA